jgi:dolichol kinase
MSSKVTPGVRTFVQELELSGVYPHTDFVRTSTAMKIDSPQLKARADLHLARRAWHALAILAVTAVFVSVNRTVGLTLLGIAAFVFIPPDLYRLRSPKFNQFVLLRFRLLLRDSEARHLSGLTYAILGISITVFLFPRDVATLSLLFLALGDPAASVFGILYGRDKLVGNKSLQGACAAFLVCGLVAFLYYLLHNMMTERLLLAAILSGLIGAVGETASIKRLDDNLTFPVVSGFFLLGLFHLFGAYS